jgi:hypothetical protein
VRPYGCEGGSVTCYGGLPAGTIKVAHGQQAATPTITPDGGSFSTVQNVSISDATPGASIHYTLDGTTPTAGSPLYSAPLVLDQNVHLLAIAVADGMEPSSATQADFTIGLTATPAPTIQPADGTVFTLSQIVTLTTSSAGAKIYLTLDGSTPTAASTLYSAPFTINSKTTVRAIAITDNMAPSSVTQAKYVRKLVPPVISVAKGTYSYSPQTATITDNDPAATGIYYCLLYSDATSCSDQTYTGPLTLSRSAVLSARAISDNVEISSDSTTAQIIIQTDFQLPSSVSGVTTTAGQPATTQLTITPLGFTGTINFTCAVPSNMTAASCSATSVQVTGPSNVSTTVTVNTTAKSIAMMRHEQWTLALLLGGFLVGGIGRRSRKRFLRWVAPMLLLIALAMANGCGGGSQSSSGSGGGSTVSYTPAGTYNLTLTASSGSLSHSVSVPVTVN